MASLGSFRTRSVAATLPRGRCLLMIVPCPSRTIQAARPACPCARSPRAAAPPPPAAPAGVEAPLPAELYARPPGLSYAAQYRQVFSAAASDGAKLPIRRLLPKIDPVAQAAVPGAKRVLLSSVAATPQVPLFFGRPWDARDRLYAGFMLAIHALALLAPFTFSYANLGLFLAGYFVTGALGITLSFHRQLSHKAFRTPKWLEYALAYCGVLAVQGDPLEWCSAHKYHHLNCDTVLDPHSPYEGFWWSHCGWLMDNTTTEARVYDRSNVADMEAQPFYRWIRDTYVWHVVAQFAALYALGGLGALVWGGALRLCWVYHITWFVNSASHVWGWQDYASGDQSRNNWWVGILAFGEGWHNNHHTFEFSACHGLEWWQLDGTWYLICLLKALGLATDIKLPSERQKQKLRIRQPASTAA
ncbi:MGDG specific palmitate delta-7 desaturase [Raphidocelis subcapitata]|uniref:MGDG specific palmitate delta-7 desaturase n=1 Tax=Raphidocelis subcapitata TaxID=307507 RepID=A0A2V0PGH3_9CHLO|nr:MGDG specific palmitate delta-7 desaturase [Raphidocelis subcapitata]|eukprot:GBF96165.1 MGDG specific palmitate delta-7 desaturase [Raphidocelis subcapitata]